MIPTTQSFNTLFIKISLLILLSLQLSPAVASTGACDGIHSFSSSADKCLYVSTTASCRPEGYIDYLDLFFCSLPSRPYIGYALLFSWLVVLFYLLGNTAATYFCSSLEGLSILLKLSPTIAGVTLLSLGNGAPDVFSSVVSFMGASTGDVGLNSVLGGAFFVSSVVTGIISISVDGRGVIIDKPSFIRDISFFISALACLLIIILIGEVTIWGALAFTSLYFVYVFAVSTTHLFTKNNIDIEAPLLEEAPEITIIKLERPRVLHDPYYCNYLWRIIRVLELPLYLPRRLTIPDITEERWSKPLAVASATLAPIFLVSILWNSHRAPILGGLFGVALGTMTFLTTEASGPPKRCLFPWLASGFLMSVIWTYMIAEELVSLLVSLGTILNISSAVLGLTVLAWGNSLGDLIANVAMAWKGGSHGAQVAVSGCYAGPLFNVLVGLGVSLVVSCWAGRPGPYVVPKDGTLFQTMGFAVGGLLWAAVILPRRGMRPDKVLGVGLLAIYVCFICVRLAESSGLIIIL